MQTINWKRRFTFVSICLLTHSVCLVPFAYGSSTDPAFVTERVIAIQSRVFGSAPSGQTLEERLAVVEKYLLGKEQTGEIEARLKALESCLNGQPRMPRSPESQDQADSPNPSDAPDAPDVHNQNPNQSQSSSKVFDPTSTKAEQEELAPLNKAIFDATKADANPLPAILPAISPEILPAISPELLRAPSAGVSASPAVQSPLESEVPIYSPDGRLAGAAPEESVSPAVSSVDTQLKALEVRVFGRSSTVGTVDGRLADIENFALGRSQHGDSASRLARLFDVLDGKASASPSRGDNGAGGDLPEGKTAIAPVANIEKVTAASQKSALPDVIDNVKGYHPSSQGSKPVRGRVESLAAEYAKVGLILATNILPTTVSVRKNSFAMRAGVMDDDQLLHAEVGVDNLTLTLERAGRRLVLPVPLADQIAPQALSATARPDNTNLAANSITLHLSGAAAQKADWAILEKYNITVLLDTSASMNVHASPCETVSKGEWSRQQIYSLASEAEKLSQGAFDFGIFSSGFQIFPDCTALGVLEALNGVKPGGGTNLADALQAAIDSRYAKSTDKPFLIVVITDALIGNQKKVDDMVVKAAQQARSSGDIKIVFLQIGNETPGRMFVDYLDTQPITEGAPYDIVSSVTWPELAQYGLRTGLIAAMAKPADNGTISDPLKASAMCAMRQNMLNVRHSGGQFGRQSGYPSRPMPGGPAGVPPPGYGYPGAPPRF
ncbi:MAG: hypothetical protein KGS72_23530 [Cyanobacteria bacterium REEB67]|nr:hypothetical protein [Cyanobacteria bacterium REEB67]